MDFEVRRRRGGDSDESSSAPGEASSSWHDDTAEEPVGRDDVANAPVGDRLLDDGRAQYLIGDAADVWQDDSPTPGGDSFDLPPLLKRRFERSLGRDLGDVTLHSGPDSARAAQDLRARAFTVGKDIHFAAGQFDPRSPEGEELLAHEVAHTAQHQGAAPTVECKPEVSRPGDATERDADAAARLMVAGEPAQLTESIGAGAPIHRTADETSAPAPDYSAVGDDQFLDSRHAEAGAGIERLLTTLSSDRWQAERVMDEPIRVGDDLVNGRFLVSRRKHAPIRDNPREQSAVIPRGADGEIVVNNQDDGPLLNFISNNPDLARLWGFRLVRNEDGQLTHLVTPLPDTLNRIRQGLLQRSPRLAPSMGVQAATRNVSGAEFQQTWDMSAPPVSVTNGYSYSHDWLTHFAAGAVMGNNTRAFMQLRGELIAGIAQAGMGGDSPLERGGLPQLSEQRPYFSAVTGVLNKVVERIIGDGQIPERDTTLISQVVSRPLAQLRASREELSAALDRLWRVDFLDRVSTALTNAEAIFDRDVAPGVQDPTLLRNMRADLNARLSRMEAAFVAQAQSLTAIGNDRATEIDADVTQMIERISAGHGQLADGQPLAQGAQAPAPLDWMTVHLGEMTLTLDREAIRHQVQAFYVSHEYNAELLRAQLHQLQEMQEQQRERVQAGQHRQQQAAQVATDGAEVSGVEAPSDLERHDVQQLPVVAEIARMFEAEVNAIVSPDAPARFIERFQRRGVDVLASILERAESRRIGSQPAGSLHHNEQARRREQERQALERARAQINPNAIWTMPDLLAGLRRAMNVEQHPVWGRWIDEALRQHQASEHHFLRNAILAALAIVGALVLTEVEIGALLGETATGAGATEMAGAVEGAETTGALAGAGEVTGIRVAADAAEIAFEEAAEQVAAAEELAELSTAN